MYVKATDGLWGFRRDASTGGLTPVPGSPMAIGQVPSFHPQGQFGVVADALQIKLYSVSADGSLPTTPIQTIDAAVIMGLPADAGRLLYGVWNADGTVIGFSGPFDAAPTVQQVVFFSFANGRLSPLPGSPFRIGGLAAKLLMSQDGYAYALQFDADALVFRVSATGVTQVSTASAREGLEASFLDRERFMFIGTEVWARQQGGLIAKVGAPARFASRGAVIYETINSHQNRMLRQNLLLFRASRVSAAGRTSVLFTESMDANGELRPAGEVPVSSIGSVIFATADGRAFLTATDAGIGVWPVDAAGNIGAQRLAGLPYNNVRGAMDPTDQFGYVMAEVGIDGVRIAADGQPQKFSPLPVGVTVRLAPLINRLVFNTR